MPIDGLSGTIDTSSANYQFADLKTDLQFYLGETTFSTWREAQQERMLNLAYKHICNVADWKFTECISALTTVSGTQEYTLPADIIGLPYDVRVLDSGSNQYVKLVPIDFRELEAFLQTTQGMPQYYYVWQGKLGLYPIPNFATANNIRMRYKFLPPDLEDDTDEPIIPIAFRHLIALQATIKCFSRVKDVAMVQLYQAEYKEVLNQMLNLLPKVQRDKEAHRILDVDDIPLPLRGLSQR